MKEILGAIVFHVLLAYCLVWLIVKIVS